MGDGYERPSWSDTKAGWCCTERYDCCQPRGHEGEHKDAYGRPLEPLPLPARVQARLHAAVPAGRKRDALEELIRYVLA